VSVRQDLIVKKIYMRSGIDYIDLMIINTMGRKSHIYTQFDGYGNSKELWRISRDLQSRTDGASGLAAPLFQQIDSHDWP
jgi:hypothetical protein